MGQEFWSFRQVGQLLQGQCVPYFEIFWSLLISIEVDFCLSGFLNSDTGRATNTRTALTKAAVQYMWNWKIKGSGSHLKLLSIKYMLTVTATAIATEIEKLSTRLTKNPSMKIPSNTSAED